MTRGSWANARSSAASRSWPSSTFAMPTDDPSLAGFTKTGRPSARIASRAVAILPERCLLDAHVAHLRQPRGGHDVLGQDLVHAQRRGGARPSRRRAPSAAPAGPAPCRPRRTARAAPGTRVGAQQAPRGAQVELGAVGHPGPSRSRRTCEHLVPRLGEPLPHRLAAASDTSCSEERPPASTATLMRRASPSGPAPWSCGVVGVVCGVVGVVCGVVGVVCGAALAPDRDRHPRALLTCVPPGAGPGSDVAVLTPVGHAREVWSGTTARRGQLAGRRDDARRPRGTAAVRAPGDGDDDRLAAGPPVPASGSGRAPCRVVVLSCCSLVATTKPACSSWARASSRPWPTTLGTFTARGRWRRRGSPWSRRRSASRRPGWWRSRARWPHPRWRPGAAAP